MSDYLYCTTNPRQPGLIQIRTSKDDPRLETLEAKLKRRAEGNYTLEWTLLVVDRALSEAALRKALRSYRAKGDKLSFTCDPMEARGEAVKLTTLRPEKGKRKVGLLRRMIRAA